MARVRELILTARVFDAQEALALSVLHKVVPAEELDAAVMAWARPVVRRPAPAVRVTKAMLNSLAAPTRLADVSLFDPELLSAVLTQQRAAR